MSIQPVDRPIYEAASPPPPAQKILALGYYDGPTSGLLKCDDGRAYRFEIVAWEPETQDLRVFTLASIPTTAFERLVELFARREAPRWPVWVPSWHEGVREETAAILKETGSIEWAIATEDLRGDFVAVRRVQPTDIVGVAKWNVFLGLGDDAPGLVPHPHSQNGNGFTTPGDEPLPR
jgi:hypothetical protein